MKILVTGGAGFIGSNIVIELLNRSHDVAVLDNLSTGFMENIPEGVKLYKNSISDPEVGRILDNGFDAICHQAAQVNLRKSVDDPFEDLRNDVVGSVKLFDAAVKAGVKQIIYASSGGAIYGDQETLPVSESCDTDPDSPYGINKLTIEKYLNYYSKISDLKGCSLRYANVFGPRQNALAEAGVIAIFIKNILNDRICKINGTGRQTRDFVYVADVVRANVNAIEKNYSGEINIGTSTESSINDIYKALREIADFKKEPEYGPALKGEQFRSSLDITKAKRDIDWEPEVGLVDGLKHTYDYFLNKNQTEI
ncbi:MAG: NAD-dependent epimerase/dehydratase family protein [bacterium]|nr:NAD-dependent epimerase/dehydratase family protein [bacterium]